MEELNPMNIWVEVAFYEDIPINVGKTIRYQGQEVALFRLEDGRILAVENRCPHKNGVLAEGLVSGEYVFCPLHDRKIDLTSGQVQAPDTGCVETFNVSVENGMVYIQFFAATHGLVG
jgi:nitrite reductase (NADH) small subunit